MSGLLVNWRNITMELRDTTILSRVDTEAGRGMMTTRRRRSGSQISSRVYELFFRYYLPAS